ncbi:MFS general substrate transporter [Sporormia fimetaria CBS 119925]|uniref:MFS general substrate transporter n=1 Tax=Sporormia fimetaria CBS 119925 TaxID=1340428 RepID=A0A6A6VEB3_9PLEO|nr:MFS general substrate transporter [Sporormia fimetaria CBS 119925]
MRPSLGKILTQTQSARDEPGIESGASSPHSQQTPEEYAIDHEKEPYSVFSAGMRAYLTYTLGIIMILSTLSATIYFPLIPMLSTYFGVSTQAINLTVTVYAIFQALTPGCFASIADLYGRRPVLLALVTVYALGSLGLVLNKKSYPMLMAFRAMQSIGGSAMPPISYGIVADLVVVSERGKMLGPMLATCNGISALGPVIGGAIALKTGGHKWVFLALLIIAVLCFFAVGFAVPETARSIAGNGSTPVHGLRRTWVNVLRGRKLTQSSRPSAAKTGVQAPKASQSLWRTFDWVRIIVCPDAAVIILAIASSYSIYYTYQVAIPVIFHDIYAYNELQIGLVFLPGLAGMTIGGMLAGKLIDANYAKEARKHGIDITEKTQISMIDFPLERARYRMILPFICFEMALVAGYGWAVQRHVHPAVPIVGQFFICAISTLLSHTASALLVDVFPDSPSTAYASGQFARCGFSAASAAIIEPLVGAVGRGWYFTIFSLFTGLTCLLCVSASRWKGIEWRRKRVAQNAKSTC